ncbi:MAG: hypothetical protein Q8880_11660, partial [Bacteroidota bacterium]|nr:hypothetical protein [Bacteroidota bacterium]
MNNSSDASSANEEVSVSANKKRYCYGALKAILLFYLTLVITIFNVRYKTSYVIEVDIILSLIVFTIIMIHKKSGWINKYLIDSEYQNSMCMYSRRISWLWGMIGFIFLIICLIMLERMQPFYFVNDDNFAQ